MTYGTTRNSGRKVHSLVCVYVCVAITYSKSKDQPGKVANPARGQLNRENEYITSMSSFAPENLVSSNGFGGPVPRQPAHLHTQAESGAYLYGTVKWNDLTVWWVFIY